MLASRLFEINYFRGRLQGKELNKGQMREVWTKAQSAITLGNNLKPKHAYMNHNTNIIEIKKQTPLYHCDDIESYSAKLLNIKRISVYANAKTVPALEYYITSIQKRHFLHLVWICH